MTSNSQINPQISSVANVDAPPINNDGNNYRASVPIFVYKELAGDLENTKNQLQQLRHVNDELVRQNQQLRQEIIKILQTAEQVQQTVKLINPPQVSFIKTEVAKNNFHPSTQVKQNSDSISENLNQESSFNLQNNQEKIIHTPKTSQTPVKSVSDVPAKVKKSRPKPPQKQKLDFEDDNNLEIENNNNSNGLNGWLLFLAILLIVFTAFGAGFIVMRPLLNSNPNNNQEIPNLSQ